MIRKLRLVNYRGFSDHEIEMRPLTVAVGHNNAGKSTVVEALRLLSVVTERLGGLTLKKPPEWLDLPAARRGATPSLDRLGIRFETLAHQYSDEPAQVVAHFEGGECIHLFVSSEGKAYAILKDKNGNDFRTKGIAQKAGFPAIRVLPQIAPLEHDESILSDDYVQKNLSSTLASRHFRNQLRMDPGSYVQFRRLAEETWPEIQVLQLRGARGLPGDALSLNIRDRGFVAEVGRMGHGLQMWLQTIWFLSRVDPNTAVVLDEPDVYMHPDLQRRLVRHIRGEYSQVIVATHSVEIVAEVEPSEILVVNRQRPRSEFADSLPAVQRLVESIGGVHNLHLARLWDSKRFLLVEGDDLGILKRLHDRLFPGSRVALDDIPNASIGGWGGWPQAVGSSFFVRNAFGETVQVYCILDSDFYTPTQISHRIEEAKGKHLHLHIWERKEIENYLLVPDAIARIISRRSSALRFQEVLEAVSTELERIVLDQREEVLDALATQYQDENRSRSIATANRYARGIVEAAFSNWRDALCMVPGKQTLSRLSSWVHQKYGRGLSANHIAGELTAREIEDEVKSVIDAIEGGKGM